MCVSQQEVGEESKLARSFDRIRSIVRKKRNKDKGDSKLEKLVNEVIIRQRIEKTQYGTVQLPQQFTTLSVLPPTALYRHSYQVSVRCEEQYIRSNPSWLAQG